MISKEVQIKLFEVVEALKGLYKSNFFKFIKKTVNTFNNYEFIISAEINEVSEKEETVDLPIDFIEGTEKFSIKINKQEIKESKISKLTIAKIDCIGLKIFPEDFNKNGENLLLIEGYKKFKEQIFKELIEKLEKGLEKDSQEDKEFFKSIADTLRKKLEKPKDKLKDIIIDKTSKDTKIDKSVLMELDPSKFYFMNELIANLYSGGIWYDVLDVHYFSDIPTELDFDPLLGGEYRLKLYENSEYVRLYVDAILYYEETRLVERIFSLDTSCSDLINYNLRGFYGGVYCPISKSEYIESLSYSLPVKEVIKKFFDYIETLPLEEQKKATFQYLIKQLIEKGLYTEELKDGISKTFSEHIGKEKEEVQAKIDEKLSKLLHFQEMPDFVRRLDDFYKGRYGKIHNDIMMLCIPTTMEETYKYIEIFAELGRFVGNVFNDVFENIKIKKEDKNEYEKDITITNYKYKVERKELEKLQREESDIIYRYIDKYGWLYNKVRHENRAVSFKKLFDFIEDSHKVLDIVLKNKDLFKS